MVIGVTDLCMFCISFGHVPKRRGPGSSRVHEADHDAREVAESDGSSRTTEDKDLAGGALNVGGLRSSQNNIITAMVYAGPGLHLLPMKIVGHDPSQPIH